MKKQVYKRKTNSRVGNFVNSCSIRGVSKAYRSTSSTIRILWISFIVLMMILLFYSVIKILREYLEYNTTVQTRLELNAPAKFPALTICPFQPFSQRMVGFIEQGGMSPMKFSAKLRKWAKHLVLQNQSGIAEKIMVYDRLRIYYQNLRQNDSLHIGLNKDELLVFCITKFRYATMLGKIDNCGIDVVTYSSPEFFNCFTVKMKQKYLNSTDYIRLIVRFPSLPDNLQPFQEHYLLNSLLKNIVGAQLTVHEEDKIPTSVRDHIYVEPNRLIQINFKNSQWKEYNTPSDQCLHDHDQIQTIKDLNTNYSYTFLECLQAYVGREILRTCKCVVASLPRQISPTTKYPYCGIFNGEMDREQDLKRYLEKLRCVSKVFRRTDELTNRQRNCFKRCEEQKFNLQISTIHWSPNMFQLEWLYRLNQAWNVLIESPINDSSRQHYKTEVLQFLNSTNLSELRKMRKKELFSDDEKYACIVLKRLSNDTFYKDEKLGLSLYGLVSRIGGSCTLYLGLTCSFFIEIIEYIIENMQKTNDRRNRNKNDEDYNHNRNNTNRETEIMSKTVELVQDSYFSQTNHDKINTRLSTENNIDTDDFDYEAEDEDEEEGVVIEKDNVIQINEQH